MSTVQPLAGGNAFRIETVSSPGRARLDDIRRLRERTAAVRLCIHAAPRDLPDAPLFGRCLDNVEAPIGSINRLVVDPLYRRRGLARCLDEARLQALWTMGCRSVVCWWAEASGGSRLFALLDLGFELAEPRRLVAGPLSMAAPMILGQSVGVAPGRRK